MSTQHAEDNGKQAEQEANVVTNDNAGMNDNVGTNDNAGVNDNARINDNAGTNDNADAKDNAGINDNAGSNDKIGINDDAGTNDNIGTTDNTAKPTDAMAKESMIHDSNETAQPAETQGDVQQMAQPTIGHGMNQNQGGDQCSAAAMPGHFPIEPVELDGTEISASIGKGRSPLPSYSAPVCSEPIEADAATAAQTSQAPAAGPTSAPNPSHEVPPVTVPIFIPFTSFTPLTSFTSFTPFNPSHSTINLIATLPLPDAVKMQAATSPWAAPVRNPFFVAPQYFYQQEQVLQNHNIPGSIPAYFYYNNGAAAPIGAAMGAGLPANTSYVTPYFNNTAHYLSNQPTVPGSQVYPVQANYGMPQRTFTQATYHQPNCPQAAYQQPVYPQAAFPQTAYQQPAIPQATIAQTAIAQTAIPQVGIPQAGTVPQAAGPVYYVPTQNY